MKKMTMILIGIVAVVIAFPAGVYAFDYLNEYEANVTFTVSSSAIGIVDVTDISASTKLMDWLSFWDTLKGHSTADRSDYYLVFVEITQDSSGETVTESQYVEVAVGSSVDMSFTLFEVEPGDSTLRIYVQSMLTQSIIFDHSVDLQVG